MDRGPVLVSGQPGARATWCCCSNVLCELSGMAPEAGSSRACESILSGCPHNDMNKMWVLFVADYVCN